MRLVKLCFASTNVSTFSSVGERHTVDLSPARTHDLQDPQEEARIRSFAAPAFAGCAFVRVKA